MISAAPATLTYTTEANASDSQSHKNGGSSEDKEKENTKCLSGYIFLCNKRTKLECYQYRVFGLPLGKKEVVEEIKSGSKLFLFDFELKLLYGVYEATSAGNLNLEPAAFEGKFPAQVKFKIFKECLPIPEGSLRYVIRENYTGSKFKQELSGKQVTKLISSFRPLAASLCQPASQALANVPRPGAMPPSLLENQLELRGRLPVMEAPYLAEVQFSHIRPLAEAQPVLNVNYPEHGSHRRAAYVENVHPTLDYRSLPIANSYVAHPQHPLFAEDVSHQLQDLSYSRYRTIGSGSHHAQVTSFERYTTVEQRARHDEVAIKGRRYNQFPLQREALYQDNVASYYSSTATDQYTPSVLHTQSYASYHQLPLHGRQYQDSIVAQSSHPAAPAHYIASDYSQQVDVAHLPSQNEAAYQDNVTGDNSNLMAIAQYASSVLQRLGPVPHDQSSLRGTQYQDNMAAYSSNPAAPAQYPTSVSQPQVEATYLPLQREAPYQDNVVPYNSEPTVPAQFTSISQPQASATNYPLQSEALHRVNVAAYYSTPNVTAQYTTPVGQQQVLPYAISEGSAPIASYYPFFAANHPSH